MDSDRDRVAHLLDELLRRGVPRGLVAPIVAWLDEGRAPGMPRTCAHQWRDVAAPDRCARCGELRA